MSQECFPLAIPQPSAPHPNLPPLAGEGVEAGFIATAQVGQVEAWICPLSRVRERVRVRALLRDVP